MNICILTRALPVHGMGGMEQHTMVLAEGLVRRGNKVTILTTGHPDGKKYEKTGSGIEIFYLPTKPGVYSLKWLFWSRKKLRELHTVNNFSVICGQNAGSLTYLISGRLRVPLVSIMHGTSLGAVKTALVQGYKPRKIFSVLYQLFVAYIHSLYSLHISGMVISISEEVTRRLKREYILNGEKIRTIPNGIDVNVFKKTKENNHIRKKYDLAGKKVILFVGRVEEEKGAGVLLHALHMLDSQVVGSKSIKQKDVVLLVVGSGSYLDELKDIAKNLGLANIIFVGSVDNNELVDYYNAADIFVMPTLCVEGLPLTLLEAMSCETAVVASDIGGIRDVIDSKNGILVKPGDVKALSMAIAKALDEKKNKSLGKAARKTVLEKYSSDRMVDKTIKVFEESVAGYEKKKKT